jgi:hypothetical protein
LEIAYEKSQKEYSITCEIEESRRLRLSLLCLDEENADLQDQLLEREERVDELEEALERDSKVFEEQEIEIEGLRGELRKRAREIESLKVGCCIRLWLLLTA